jgi:hypothetical protein
MKHTNIVMLLVAILSTTIVTQTFCDDDTVHPHREQMTVTPIGPVQLASVLRDSHVAAFGTTPSRQRLAAAWAQIALENGHGKFIYNHNVGNVLAYKNSQDYYIVNTRKFRAYNTFEDGAKVYWFVIQHCQNTLRQFDAGSMTNAVEQLKRCGYFEADVDTYTRTMTSLYHHAMTKVLPDEERTRQRRDQDAGTTNDH